MLLSLYSKLKIMGIVIGFIVVLLFLISVSNKQEKKRKIQKDADNLMWYNTVKKCLWCGRKYRVKDGDRDYCSRKCLHEDSDE